MKQNTATKTLRVAVDVGGTFTDVCIFDERDQSTRAAKVPSTPHDPMEAVVAGVRVRPVTRSFSGDPVLHGTTVATNALIIRRFQPPQWCAARGSATSWRSATARKMNSKDSYADVGAPYIKRRNRYEVPERIDCVGSIVTPSTKTRHETSHAFCDAKGY